MGREHFCVLTCHLSILEKLYDPICFPMGVKDLDVYFDNHLECYKFKGFSHLLCVFFLKKA